MSRKSLLYNNSNSPKKEWIVFRKEIHRDKLKFWCLKNHTKNKIINIINTYRYSWLYMFLGLAYLNWIGALCGVVFGAFIDSIQNATISKHNKNLPLKLEDKKVISSDALIDLLELGYKIIIYWLILSLIISKIFILVPGSRQISYYLISDMAEIIPATRHFEQYFQQRGEINLISLVSFLIPTFWFITALILIFFLGKIVVLFRTMGDWYLYFSIFNPIRTIVFIIIFIGVMYFTFNVSFLGAGPVYPNFLSGGKGFTFVMLAPSIFLLSLISFTILVLSFFSHLSNK